jgi:flagellar capping protein FliD
MANDLASANQTAAQQAAAANKANAQAILSSLGAGSGVNVATLAQSLVDAEGNPKKNAINAKIDKNEARISGLSAVKFMMNELKAKLSALKDRNSFNTVSASNTNPSALGISASTAASVGQHQISVQSVSQAQSAISSGFASKTTALNSGKPFSFSITQTNKADISTGTIAADNAPTVSLANVSFGSKPAVDDFRKFSIKVNGQSFSFTPTPDGPSLAALADDLQRQLQSADGGNTDLSVTVSNTNLIEITSGSGRTLSEPNLVSGAAQVGTPASGSTSFAVISGVAFSSRPSVTDFRNFSVTIDGKAYSVTPKPASATMEDLAADIQKQLRVLDGTTDLSVSTTNGDRLEINSINASRQISAPELSTTTKINLDTGAREGSSTGSSISNASFGYAPSVNDFVGLDLTIDGKALSIVPVPSEPTLNALAESIQSQLRLIENTSDISVEVDNGTIQFRSLSNRSIADARLTAKRFTDTPDGLVSAINSANRGYKAQLVNDGSPKPFKIMITGEAGETESFSLTSSATTSLNFFNLTNASDAIVNVDGVSYTRKSNTITDVVAGLTLDLKSTTAVPVTTMITRDTSSLQTKLSELVTAYNDFNDIVGETTNPKSTLETYGATLVSNNTVRIVRQQIRSVILGDSTTPGTTVKNLAQIGLSIDEKGVMKLDSAKAEAALNSNFEDVVKLFTGGYNNLTAYSTLPAGIAGEGVRKLTKLLDQNGPLQMQTQTATALNEEYQRDLAKLQTRLDSLLARYNKQFAAMDSLVGRVNSQKTSLKSTFEAMMAAYTNN